MSTATTVATYRFMRGINSPAGLMSKQRPSTDAMTVIGRWAVRGGGRTYVVDEDKDEYLVATLSFYAPDAEKAATDLDMLCANFGLQREFVQE